MFDSSNYEKLLSDFTLKVATYSYNKKLKELSPDYEAKEETLSKAQSAAIALKNELMKLPKGAQSRLLLQRIEEILKAGN